MTRTVIIIGPPPSTVGGMASVVSQMRGLGFGAGYRVAFFPTTSAPDERKTLWQRVGRHVRHLGRLRRTIRQAYRPIVHIHTCSGYSFLRSALDMMVARRHGCPTVLHIHGARFDAFYETQPAYRRMMIRRCLTLADRVIALSEGWSRKLRDMAPNARLSVIENAIESPPSIAAPRRAGPLRFVLLARMDTWKGIDDLLSACATVAERTVEFEVMLAGPAGSAGDATTLREKINAIGLEDHVRYIGSVHGSEKDTLLRDADAYVLSSWNEGLPISLLEALAYGLPSVCTRVGAVPEVIVEGREGLLVPARQPEALAEAMLSMINDPARRATMSAAARRLAQKRFSADRLRSDLVRLYDSLGCADSATSTAFSEAQEVHSDRRAYA